MSNLMYSFDPVVPAGTPIAAPVTFDLSFPQAIVDLIEIHVPPGPNGNLGFAFANADQPIVPFNSGQFIVADDDRFEWALSGQITSGAWQLIAYNTGIYDHQVFIRFLVSSISLPVAQPQVTLIESSTLAAPPDASLIPVPDLIAGA